MPPGLFIMLEFDMYTPLLPSNPPLHSLNTAGLSRAACTSALKTRSHADEMTSSSSNTVLGIVVVAGKDDKVDSTVDGLRVTGEISG
jgi:hypothetical protein